MLNGVSERQDIARRRVVMSFLRRFVTPLCLGAFVVSCLLIQPAQAVVVFKRGQTQPIAGYLVRETDREVVLRQPREAGRTEDVLIPKTEIEDLIHTVDPARLASLDPDRPQDYREYADELAEKKLDPEARDAALRLYVIAAHVGQASRLPKDDQAHAAMLGLIALARSPAEETRFRAAAYLADPRHDPALLRPASGVAPRPAGGTADHVARQKLLEAVHHARRGKGDVAGRLIERPEIAAELEAVSSLVTKDELLRICRTKELEDGQLRTLLKLELALDPTLAPESAPSSAAQGDARSWSQLLKKPQPPQRPLNLLQLTEFDPRQSVYREGKWVEP
jgi:hypothetical protein